MQLGEQMSTGNWWL